MNRCHPSALVAILLLVPATASVGGGTAVSRVDGLRAPATVTRDVHGIPHVVARNAHDVYFLQGWVHAEDRFFQMDVSRHQAYGTLAELLGPDALPGDAELRALGLRRAAERSLAALSAAARGDLEAYAAGVNAWLDDHPLPVEHGALERTTTEPWTPVDSVVISKLIAVGLSFELDVETTLDLVAYEAAGDAEGFDGRALFFEDLFRSDAFEPVATVPDALGRAEASRAAPSRLAGTSVPDPASVLSPAALRLARRLAARVRATPLLAAPLRRRDSVQGSNLWAVSGAHTADGRPLLANDPHLALGTPATFHQVHLRAPADGIDLYGSSLPGLPYVIVGQNRYVTWGTTSDPLDVTDTFEETLVVDADGAVVATLHEGEAEPVQVFPETYRFNVVGDGEPDELEEAPAELGLPPVTLVVPRRNGGPLVAVDPQAGVGLSVQYTGFSATREIDSLRTWATARSLADFEAGVRYFDCPSQNWVYADVRGHVAFFTSGEIPLREDLQAGFVDGLPPWFIRDGSGGNEWMPAAADRPRHQALPYAVLPPEEMPQVIDPPAGWLVNANNDPAGTTLDNDPLNQLRPGGGIYFLDAAYDLGFRAGRITDRLRWLVERGAVTARDMRQLQADVVMPDALVFVPHLVRAFERRYGTSVPAGKGGLATAVHRLAAWDGSTPTGIALGYDASDVTGRRLPPSAAEQAASVAATLYSVWRGQVLNDTIDAVLLPRGLRDPGSGRSLLALRRLLEGFDEHRGLGASGLDFFAGGEGATPEERRDSVLLGSLERVLERLSGPEFAVAFWGSSDQDDWRWGLLHRLVLEHPLGAPYSIPPALGRFSTGSPEELPGIPVDGGFEVIDAASHDARTYAVNDYMFDDGPVRRYVGRPGRAAGSIEGWTSMPGGASGTPGSPLSYNLLLRWLTNDPIRVRQDPRDVHTGARGRHLFLPARR